jgi:hypothetical protein
MPPERRLEPAGYARLLKDFDLACLPPHHVSYVASWEHRKTTTARDGRVEDDYPPAYTPGEGLVAQLEFALKYDGLDLGVFRSFFEAVDRDAWEDELTLSLRERKTGIYLRRIWYLYEAITGRSLDLPDAEGAYVPLADPEAFYTAPPRRSRRHRVEDNLLGTVDFSPIVRRTPVLAAYAERRLADRAREVIAAYDDDALRRAVAWLYTKETKSSFAIEHEAPSPKRLDRFVQLLKLAPEVGRLEKRNLVDLQRATVDPRFANDGWREDQVYVGQNVGYAQQVHFIAPRPGADLSGLMAAFLSAVERLEASDLDPVIVAAIVSFGFVFLHPFSDGNGRLHRFLIHRELSRRGFVPDGLIFPVSAVMLDRRAEYDAALETFSRPLMELLDWDIDHEGVVTVTNDSADWYRHFDATPLAEALYGWIDSTIETDLRNELAFLVRFRDARAAVRDVVDLPDNLLDLFVVLVLQNRGKLSSTKRTQKFRMLTDEEIAAMEEAVRHASE